MKKVLYTAKVDSHIIHFHLPFIKYLKEIGYETYVASEGDTKMNDVDYKYNFNFGNNPLSFKNFSNYKKMKKLIMDNDFDIIHTHTAIASVITRLAAFRVGGIRKVVYTAHGFHFLKGGPFLNWIIYYPIEKIMSYLTTDLILINKQDYNLAKSKLHAKNIHYVPGVGIKDVFFTKKVKKPSNIKIEKGYLYITYVAELNKNKNQILAIKAFQKLLNNIPNVILLLIGEGKDRKKLQNYIEKNNLKGKVNLLGYCTNIEELLSISSVAISTSKREGLAVNLIESMAVGLPIVGCRTRGVTDLIDRDNGYIVDFDIDELSSKIYELLSNKKLNDEISKSNKEKAKKYNINSILEKLINIYEIPNEEK